MSESNLQPKKKSGKIIGIVIAAVAAVAIAIVAAMFILPKSAGAKALTEKLDLGAKYLVELNYEQAEVEYLAAIQIDPKCEDAYLGLAEVYVANGDFYKAKEILEEGLQKADNTDDIIKRLEEICAELGIPMPEIGTGKDNAGAEKNNGSGNGSADINSNNSSGGQHTAGSGNTGFAVSSAPAISANTAVAGNKVVFGSYEQDNNADNGAEPIEWVVVYVQNGQALLLSTYCLDAMAFAPGSRQANWEHSEFRTWLNGDFYTSAFSEEEKQKIVPQGVETLRNNGFEYYFGGVEDNVSLLSGDQIWHNFGQNDEQYMIDLTYSNEGFKAIMEAKGTPYAIKKKQLIVYETGCSDWYIRTDAWEANSRPDLMFNYVNFMGSSMQQWDEIATYYGSHYYMGIRPCILVSVEGSADSSFGGEGGFYGGMTGGESGYTGGEYIDEGYVGGDFTDSGSTGSDAPAISAENAWIGNTVTFGSYLQDGEFSYSIAPIEWIVLDVSDGEAFLLSKNILDAHVCGMEYDRSKFDLSDSYLWEVSTLRTFLNGYFFDSAFSDAEKEKLVPMYVGETIDWEAAETSLYDNVSVLSAEQVWQYFPVESERCAQLTDWAYNQGVLKFDNGCGSWWIREDPYLSVVFGMEGFISGTDLYMAEGVRPCIKVVIE